VVVCGSAGNGIEFISLHEGVDTSTPNGRLIFGIFASIAEFERELIRDRVKSGIAAARSKGKRLGRPMVSVDAARIAALRDSGASWSAITRQLGLSAGTVKRAYYNLSKNPAAEGSVTRCFDAADSLTFACPQTDVSGHKKML
jgi:DNA invertase Pin-like site-specific DNA recombinase